MSERQYEHLGHTELASMCHHRDAKIAALEHQATEMDAVYEKQAAALDAQARQIEKLQAEVEEEATKAVQCYTALAKAHNELDTYRAARAASDDESGA